MSSVKQTDCGLLTNKTMHVSGKVEVFTVEVAVEYPSSGKLKRRTQQFLLNFLS